MKLTDIEAIKLASSEINLAKRAVSKATKILYEAEAALSKIIKDCDHVYPDGRLAKTGGFPHQFCYCAICGVDEEYGPLYYEVLVALSPVTSDFKNDIYNHHVFRLRHEIDEGKAVKVRIGIYEDYVLKEDYYTNCLDPIEATLNKITTISLGFYNHSKVAFSEIKETEKEITLIYKGV